MNNLILQKKCAKLEDTHICRDLKHLVLELSYKETPLRTSFLQINVRQQPSHKLQITNYKYQITNYKLQITNYKLLVTNYKLQIVVGVTTPP